MNLPAIDFGFGWKVPPSKIKFISELIISWAGINCSLTYIFFAWNLLSNYQFQFAEDQNIFVDTWENALTDPRDETSERQGMKSNPNKQISEVN